MSCATFSGTQNGSVRPTCPEGQGALPNCGPFAVPFVVEQGADPKKYDTTKALETGTLFPDLNLPFHLKVNAAKVADTPSNQLRALAFVIQELGLYLDTHPDDSEAFALFQSYVALEQRARETFLEKVGPLTMTDSARASRYTWSDGPWPWQYREEG